MDRRWPDLGVNSAWSSCTTSGSAEQLAVVLLHERARRRCPSSSRSRISRSRSYAASASATLPRAASDAHQQQMTRSPAAEPARRARGRTLGGRQLGAAEAQAGRGVALQRPDAGRRPVAAASASTQVGRHSPAAGCGGVTNCAARLANQARVQLLRRSPPTRPCAGRPSRRSTSTSAGSGSTIASSAAAAQEVGADGAAAAWRRSTVSALGRSRRRTASPHRASISASRGIGCGRMQDQVGQQHPCLPARARAGTHAPAVHLDGEGSRTAAPGRRDRRLARRATSVQSALDRNIASGRRTMIRQVRCECGFTARGRTDDEVIALILAACRRGPPRSGRGRDRRRRPAPGSSSCPSDPGGGRPAKSRRTRSSSPTLDDGLSPGTTPGSCRLPPAEA